jgi:ATP-dependent 26S proteasome regulatory subunit
MTSLTQWGGYDKNMWSPTGATRESLPPGFYNISAADPDTWALRAQPLVHDTIIKTGVASKICNDIDKFLDSKALYDKFGFLHKRGVLLIGQPGVGKTMTSMILCHHMIGKGGVAVNASMVHRNMGKTIANVLQAIRSLHVDMPILNLLEDIDTIFQVDAIGLLSMLDGDTQINNVVHVAITNNPQYLDARLIKRRGRFDDVVWVGPPEAAVRKAYLETTLPDDTSATVIEEIVAASDGLALADLKEVINGVFVLGRSVKQTIQAIHTNNQRADAIADAIGRMADADTMKEMQKARADIAAIINQFGQ